MGSINKNKLMNYLKNNNVSLWGGDDGLYNTLYIINKEEQQSQWELL